MGHSKTYIQLKVWPPRARHSSKANAPQQTMSPAVRVKWSQNASFPVRRTGRWPAGAASRESTGSTLRHPTATSRRAGGRATPCRDRVHATCRRSNLATIERTEKSRHAGEGSDGWRPGAGARRSAHSASAGWQGACAELGRTKRSRRRMVVVAVLVVAVVFIAIVVSLFASLAGESQSYRDGYSAGGTAYTAYADAKITSDQACGTRRRSPASRPAHDDPAQWVQGCVDAFNLAASDN